MENEHGTDISRDEGYTGMPEPWRCENPECLAPEWDEKPDGDIVRCSEPECEAEFCPNCAPDWSAKCESCDMPFCVAAHIKRIVYVDESEWTCEECALYDEEGDESEDPEGDRQNVWQQQK